MAELSRTSDPTKMVFSINNGKNVEDTTLLKAGAKDSISGTGTTDKFETSQSYSGPFGGEKKG